jgi:phospholipase D1/2
MGLGCSKESSSSSSSKGATLPSIWPSEPVAIELAKHPSSEELKLLSVTVYLSSGTSWTVHRTLTDFFRLFYQAPISADFSFTLRLWKANLDPKGHEHLTATDLEDLSKFVLAACMHQNFKDSEQVSAFCEISLLSFEQSRKSLKEGNLWKRRGGRKFIRGTFISRFRASFRTVFQGKYSKRYFLLFEDHLMYTSDFNSSNVLDVIVIDSQFECTEVDHQNSCTPHRYSLRIKNGYRSMVVKFSSKAEMSSWFNAINSAAQKIVERGPNPNNSSTPVRDSVHAVPLVDGEAYFEKVFEALQDANSEIFISGWWLTPDLLLKRGNRSERVQEEASTLVQILAKAGERGVSVFIVLYQEFSLAPFYNDAAHAARLLSTSHVNVQVLTHPVRTGANATFYWSHHMKLVIVDHFIAFIGGLDLCLGRFDSPGHVLFDPQGDKFPGKDFINFNKRDFKDGIEAREPLNGDSLIDRANHPRLPWHDVAMMLIGDEIVNDLSRHFVQLWNHVKTDKHKYEEKYAYMRKFKKKTTAISTENDSMRRSNTKEKLVSWFKKLKTQLISPNKHSHPSSSPSSPPPDVASEGSLNEEIRQTPKVASATVISGHLSGLEINEDNHVPLISRLTSIAQASPAGPAGPCGPSSTEYFGQSSCLAQILRSLSWWSFGLPLENSILCAYLNLIYHSRDYVYIENQFFITNCIDSPGISDSSPVKNLLGKALCDRIKRAEVEKDNFKVFIVLPALPAFQLAQPADFFTKETYTLRATLHFIAESLRSMRAVLGNDVFERRVTVHSLRKIDQNQNGEFCQEQIYIHSKLMIVDDAKILIGSANINDRSLVGNRDSEICALIENEETAKQLRLQLWQEHVGQDFSSLSANSEASWDLWKTTSRSNSKFFHEEFKAWPSNFIRNRSELEALPPVSSGLEAGEFKGEFKGRLVDYAMDFLCEEADILSPLPLSMKLVVSNDVVL